MYYNAVRTTRVLYMVGHATVAHVLCSDVSCLLSYLVYIVGPVFPGIQFLFARFLSPYI